MRKNSQEPEVRMYALFSRVFEITQFWGSTSYKGHARNSSGMRADLHVDRPEEGQWLYSIAREDGDYFIGDVVPPFLPTRQNIDILNDGCRRSVALLQGYESGEIKKLPETILSELKPYKGEIARDLTNDQYRSDLLRVLRSDWGLEFPLVHKFGQTAVKLHFLEGLPVAPAMVKAALPIIASLKGPFEVASQSLVRERGRIFDELQLNFKSGNSIRQRFDISDFFHRSNLDYDEFTVPPSIEPEKDRYKARAARDMRFLREIAERLEDRDADQIALDEKKKAAEQQLREAAARRFGVYNHVFTFLWWAGVIAAAAGILAGLVAWYIGLLSAIVWVVVVNTLRPKVVGYLSNRFHLAKYKKISESYFESRRRLDEGKRD